MITAEVPVQRRWVTNERETTTIILYPFCQYGIFEPKFLANTIRCLDIVRAKLFLCHETQLFRLSLRDNFEDVYDIKNLNVVDYVVVEVGQGSGSLKLIKSEIQLYLETF